MMIGTKPSTVSIRDLRVETMPVASLKPCARNPRTHSKKQIREIVDNIERFGFPERPDRDPSPPRRRLARRRRIGGPMIPQNGIAM
jgi:hypothetical protein